MVAGIVAGKQKSRQTEAFAKDITGNIRRFFGIAGKENPSDTTLYNLAKNLNPEGMEKTLKSQIKQGLQTKAIRNDDFAIGAISIDGKGAGGAKGQAPNEVCHQTVCDKEGSAAWYLYALRACLISALAKPIIGNVYIPNKGGESTYFGPLLRSLVKSYSKLFQIVMVDAGMTSQGNAKLVLGLGKWYVMAVKGNQPTLHSLAKEGHGSITMCRATGDPRTSGGSRNHRCAYQRFDAHYPSKRAYNRNPLISNTIYSFCKMDQLGEANWRRWNIEQSLLVDVRGSLVSSAGLLSQAGFFCTSAIASLGVFPSSLCIFWQ